MDIAKLLGIISADRQQRQFRRQAASNFAKAIKVGRIASVVNRVFAAAQHIAPVAPVRIFYDARSPMPRGNVRDVECAMAISIPPLQFHNFFEAEIRDQVEKVMRHHKRGRGPSLAARLPGYSAERLAMQVIKVRVSYEDHIRRRQIAQVQTRLPQAFKHEEPARKVGINDDVMSADLQEETGMSDESDAEFTIRNQCRLMRLSGTRCDRGMPDQARELACTLAQCAIF